MDHAKKSFLKVLLTSLDCVLITINSKFVMTAGLNMRMTAFLSGPAHEFLNTYLHKDGLLCKWRPPRERKVPGSNPASAGIFSGSSHTSDLNIGTPVATLPGTWRYRVSTGTGRPGVSIL